MATTWTNAPAAVGAAAPSNTQLGSRLLGRVIAAIRDYRARVATLNELHSLDARDLADLRISPYDFDDIARGTFRR